MAHVADQDSAKAGMPIAVETAESERSIVAFDHDPLPVMVAEEVEKFLPQPAGIYEQAVENQQIAVWKLADQAESVLEPVG